MFYEEDDMFLDVDYELGAETEDSLLTEELIEQQNERLVEDRLYMENFTARMNFSDIY